MFKRFMAVSFLLVALVFAATANAGWVPIAGKANDIAGGGETAYIVGSEAGGFGIYKWFDGEWVAVEGGKGQRVGADAEGNVWTVNKDGKVMQYRVAKGSWRPIAGNATDIAVANDGTAYIVGSAQSNFAVYRYEDGAFEIVGGFEGKAHRIAAGDNGDVWVVMEDGSIMQFRASKGSWRPIAGKATDIAAAGEKVYIVGSERGGYGIYEWSDGAWEKVDGSEGYNIGATTNGKIWVARQDTKIMQYR